MFAFINSAIGVAEIETTYILFFDRYSLSPLGDIFNILVRN